MLASVEPEELLTVKQAAALLHLGERTVRNHINGQRLPARKLTGGKGWLIRRADLLNALESAESRGQAKPSVRPGIVEAGIDPMQVAPHAGIIQRTHTPEGRARAIAALRRLRAGNVQDQASAWKVLKSALDEDRLSYRKLFPEHETVPGNEMP